MSNTNSVSTAIKKFLFSRESSSLRKFLYSVFFVASFLSSMLPMVVVSLFIIIYSIIKFRKTLNKNFYIIFVFNIILFSLVIGLVIYWIYHYNFSPKNENDIINLILLPMLAIYPIGFVIEVFLFSDLWSNFKIQFWKNDPLFLQYDNNISLQFNNDIYPFASIKKFLFSDEPSFLKFLLYVILFLISLFLLLGVPLIIFTSFIIFYSYKKFRKTLPKSFAVVSFFIFVINFFLIQVPIWLISGDENMWAVAGFLLMPAMFFYLIPFFALFSEFKKQFHKNDPLFSHYNYNTASQSDDDNSGSHSDNNKNSQPDDSMGRFVALKKFLFSRKSSARVSFFAAFFILSIFLGWLPVVFLTLFIIIYSIKKFYKTLPLGFYIVSLIVFIADIYIIMTYIDIFINPHEYGGMSPFVIIMIVTAILFYYPIPFSILWKELVNQVHKNNPSFAEYDNSLPSDKKDEKNLDKINEIDLVEKNLDKIDKIGLVEKNQIIQEYSANATNTHSDTISNTTKIFFHNKSFLLFYIIFFVINCYTFGFAVFLSSFFIIIYSIIKFRKTLPQNFYVVAVLMFVVNCFFAMSLPSFDPFYLLNFIPFAVLFSYFKEQFLINDNNHFLKHYLGFSPKSASDIKYFWALFWIFSPFIYAGLAQIIYDILNNPFIILVFPIFLMFLYNIIKYKNRLKLVNYIVSFFLFLPIFVFIYITFEENGGLLDDGLTFAFNSFSVFSIFVAFLYQFAIISEQYFVDMYKKSDEIAKTKENKITQQHPNTVDTYTTNPHNTTNVYNYTDDIDKFTKMFLKFPKPVFYLISLFTAWLPIFLLSFYIISYSFVKFRKTLTTSFYFTWVLLLIFNFLFIILLYVFVVNRSFILFLFPYFVLFNILFLEFEKQFLINGYVLSPNNPPNNPQPIEEHNNSQFRAVDGNQLSLFETQQNNPQSISSSPQTQDKTQ